MDEKELKKIQKKVQDALNKLISEEWIAGTMYLNMISLCDPMEVKLISGLFEELADDEIRDHFVKLTTFALQNGFEIPLSVKDCKKFSEKTLVKISKDLKKNQDAGYYVDQLMMAEDLAIGSYEQMLNDEDLPEGFKSLIRPIYHEEREHICDARTLKYAYDASMQLSL